MSAAFPLELAAAALCPSPPFNANAVGAPLTQTCIYSVVNLVLCASKWGERKKEVSKINPGDSADILASYVFLLAVYDGIWLIRKHQCYKDLNL